MDSLKKEFMGSSGIDLTDHEHAGVFPYFNSKTQKWSSISRGEAWKRYAEYLENKLSQ